VTIADFLSGVAGVWEGRYRVLRPDGEMVEEYASRQETRLVGDQWYERIVYRRDPAEVLDFRARVIGDQVIFDDPGFQGTSHLVGDRIVVFPYRWKARPEEEIVEIIILVTDDRRTRLWQHFRGGLLDRLTLIEEERRPGETPEVWE
jgi:hypothetical protein